MDNDIKLGKFISLILRHKPETIDLKLDDDLLNIPLFMVDYTEKIINIAMNKLKEKNNG